MQGALRSHASSLHTQQHLQAPSACPVHVRSSRPFQRAPPSNRWALSGVTAQQRRWAHAQHITAASNNGNGASAAAAVDAAAPGSDSNIVENLAIIGSGPAGYTAAIYAARANLKPVVFEGLQNGRGGQLMTTTEVENFPGFPEGITGPDLMDKMRAQSERWGAELYTEDVESVDLSQRPFTIRSGERTVRAHSVIIATGATARRLNLPSEPTYWSKGISACAICDGASPAFKNQEVAVVGGGDSAAEEAVYLTKYAAQVHLLVRGPHMRASKAMQDRVMANAKVSVHYNTKIDDAYGNGVLQGLHTRDAATGEARDLQVRGLFYGIGHTPNTSLIAGQVELDEAGYVKVRNGVQTSVEGVYAAGDLHDHEWRQAITAAGSGCMAALSAERYLSANGLAREFKQQDQPQSAPAEEASKGAAMASTDGSEFDIENDKHRGQFALRKLYHESDRLIAVLYTSPTCGPCRTLKPIFSKVVDEFTGRIHFVEIDIEEDGEIAEAAGVNGTPTVQFFKAKERVANMPGVKMKGQYRELISSHL